MTRSPIRLADPAADHRAAAADIDAAVTRVLAGGRYILGPEVAAFEQEVAEACAAAHGIGVASGTDALILSLTAAGIGPGDEVLVPAFTFFATAEAVLRVGATPVFCDVENDTLCIDPVDARRRHTDRTRAVVAVHLYGHPADLTALSTLCAERGSLLIEDAAQAFGAALGDRPVGGIGDLTALSFFPSKNLGGAGDGGMVLARDGEIADRVRMLRAHGARTKHRPELVGFNSRLDEVQAAILRIKLPRVAAGNERRRVLAARYDEALADAPVMLPSTRAGAAHAFHLYVVRTEQRDTLASSLSGAGIESAVHYPVPVPFTPACAPLGHAAGEFPVAEAAAEQVLALPMHPHLTDDDVDRVAAEVRRALA